MTRWCLVSRKNLVSTCIEIYVFTLQPDNQTVPPRWVTFFVLLFSTMQCILFRFLGWRLLVSGITSLTGTTNWLYIRDDQPPVTVVSVGGTIIAGSTSGIFSAVYTSYTHYTDQTDFTRSVVDNTYTAIAMTTPILHRQHLLHLLHWGHLLHLLHRQYILYCYSYCTIATSLNK